MNFTKLLIVLTVCLVVPAAGTMTALGDTIAYWRFEESTLPTAFDETANDLDLTTGVATSSTAVPVNPVPQTGATNLRSASFNGSTEYFTHTDNALLNFGADDPFTLEAWIKPDSASGMVIVDKRSLSGKNEGYEFYITGAGNLALWLDAGDSTLWVGGATTLSTTAWTHVAGMRLADGTAKVYVNGVLDGTSAGTLADSLDNSSPFNFAQDVLGGGRFDGGIDECRISDTALAPSQFLNAVPEPGSIVMLTGLALAGLGYGWRKRKHHA